MISEDGIDWDELTKPDFNIDKTEFKVKKMNAYDAVPYADKLREQLAVVLGGAAAIDNDQLAIGSLIMGLIGLPADFREEIQRDMFDLVEWRCPPTFDRWHGLSGMEVQAFRHLEYTDVYYVLLRSLAVNFYPKREGIVSFMKSLMMTRTSSSILS